MSTPRLRARTCIVDADLARHAVVDLPDHPVEPRLPSLADFVRSLVPFRPQPGEAEGPAALAEAGTRS